MPDATRGGVRRIVLGFLAWYLALLGVLALLEYFAARKPAGLPDRGRPHAGAPAEGPTRHQ
jgi:hypothetical protein